jgi:hypothetical protein
MAPCVLTIDVTVLAVNALTVLALAEVALAVKLMVLAVEALTEEALTEEALAEFLMLPADLSALLLRTRVSGVTVEGKSPMRCCCRCQPSCCVECVGTAYMAGAC